MCLWSGGGDPSNMKKYTCKAYDTVAEARTSLARYFGFYNSRRPHSSLDRQTPIRPTSPRFRRSRQPEPGRRSTYPPKNLFRQAEPPQSTTGGTILT